MTKIIATLGPVSNSPETILELYNAGVSIFRLNFSHGSHAWHKECINTIHHTTPHASIMLDTKGPEMRTGIITDRDHNPSSFHIEAGEILTLVDTEKEQNVYTEKNKKKLFISYTGLKNDVVSGDIIALNSGLQNLEVLEVVQNKYIKTKVLQAGEIFSKRHVNLVGKDVSLQTTTEADKNDIIFGLQNNIDSIAISFIRHSSDIEYIQNICKNTIYNPSQKEIKIFAKIETQEAMNNLDEIANIADGLMVARGDLGVETPFEKVPQERKTIIETTKKYNKEVIVATEMLESMITKPRPTRAEVSDIALAVWQKADYTMLSGETAAGKYPVTSVKVMQKVIDANRNETLHI